MLSPENFKRGARSVLASSDQEIICEELICVAERGFSVDSTALKLISGAVGKGMGASFINGSPRDDWVRESRSRYRNLSYRKHNRKSCQKLKGEDS